MSITSNLFMTFFKIKILSSIPGRLRINIPNYKTILKGADIEDKDIINLLKLIKGVQSVEFNTHTENFLILYNSDILEEKKITKMIKEAIGAVVSYMDSMKKDKIQIEQLTQIVKEVLINNK